MLLLEELFQKHDKVIMVGGSGLYAKALLEGLNEFPEVDTDIMIVSTVGEMGSFYNQADIAFIGNSLDFKRIKTGKNPFEAIQEKCVVIHGPKMLEPSYAEISKLGISEVVFNKDDICEALLQNVSIKEREMKIKRGLNFLKGNRGIIDKFLAKII